jgi:hypothetical protein
VALKMIREVPQAGLPHADRAFPFTMSVPTRNGLEFFQPEAQAKSALVNFSVSPTAISTFSRQNVGSLFTEVQFGGLHYRRTNEPLVTRNGEQQALTCLETLSLIC